MQIDPKSWTVFAAELAKLYLPDMTIVLLGSGRKVGRRSTALAGLDIEALAPVALMQMRELVLLPGTVVTVDVTIAPVPLMCTRINAAIWRKLFKVLAAHVKPNEIATLSPEQRALVIAA